MSRPLVPIVAAYSSRCSICDERIVEDVDEIVCVDGEWVHADCAENEGENVAR